jgi:hypothetical protein
MRELINDQGCCGLYKHFPIICCCAQDKPLQAIPGGSSTQFIFEFTLNMILVAEIQLTNLFRLSFCVICQEDWFKFEAQILRRLFYSRTKTTCGNFSKNRISETMLRNQSQMKWRTAQIAGKLFGPTYIKPIKEIFIIFWKIPDRQLNLWSRLVYVVT